MSIRFEGRVAIITGAGGGLGREHALLLAQLGAKVVVNDPGVSVSGDGDDSSAAERVATEIRAAGGEATVSTDTVTDPESARRIVQTALDAYGRLDILINNAGILRDRSFGKMDLSDFQSVMDVHLYGAVYCTKAAWPVMTGQRYGRIVVTTSPSGYSGIFGQSNYAAAKLAVLGFMRVLALEGAKHNVLVNAISPSAATRMTEGIIDPRLARYMRPALVSPAVAFLCSEAFQESAVIISAMGGHFATIQMCETTGVQFDPRTPVSPDMVSESYERICQLKTLAPLSQDPMGDLEKRLQQMGVV